MSKSYSDHSERIDTIEREVDGETYKIWTKKLPVSKFGEKKILISEKMTEDESEKNPVKYSRRTRLTHRRRI